MNAKEIGKAIRLINLHKRILQKEIDFLDRIEKALARDLKVVKVDKPTKVKDTPSKERK